MEFLDYLPILPLVFLVVWAVVLLTVDLWIPKNRKDITAALSAVGMVISLILSLTRAGNIEPIFGGSIVVDGFATFLDAIFLFSGLAGIALAYQYLKRMGIERSEYYILLLITISGMMLMSYAYDLMVVFIALELLSLPLYILTGFVRFNLRSEEAALKYFLLGAFSSGFVLYGVALIFGATAHTDFGGILSSASSGLLNKPLFITGAALLLVGFGFKSALVPFHMWSPDVYQGAPSPVTAFMSVGAKAAGFAALLRVFIVAFPNLSADLVPLLWALAALTMVVGNVLAISQTNIKRLLAYSSIAQSGYMLMAFVPYASDKVRADTVAAMLFYLAAYCIASFGAWAVVISLEKKGEKGLNLDDFAGLGKRHPFLAAAMTVFMLSFTGVPLTLGFWGKFFLFSTAVEGGYWGLALVGLLASLVSAYYYLRLVVIMYMRPGEAEAEGGILVNITSLGCALAVVLLSFIPNALFYLAAQAILKVL